MAQNIELMGALYPSVPAVVLPTASGGSATFYDVSGSQHITQNGTYDVKTLEEVVVGVPVGLKYETATWIPSADTARPEITFFNQHNNAPLFIGLSDISAASSITTNSNLVFIYYDIKNAVGTGYPYTTSGVRVGMVLWVYKTSNGTSSGIAQPLYGQDNTGDSSTSYARYFANETGFHPYGGSTSRYFRKGRQYKWFAVWGQYG